MDIPAFSMDFDILIMALLLSIVPFARLLAIVCFKDGSSRANFR